MEYFARLKYAAVCVLAALMLQGCDWIKGRLGMPTSDDIAKMKVELLRKDSLERAAMERALQDSLLNALPEVEKVGGYHVIVGSFKDYRNADAFAEYLGKKGFSPCKIELKKDYMMVSLGENATMKAAAAQIREVWELDLCPDDVWIYDASQGLHK